MKFRRFILLLSAFLLCLGASAQTPSRGPLFRTRAAKAAAFTVAAQDREGLFDATTGTWSVSLTSSATLGGGFTFSVFNSGSGTITIDPAGSETIRDAAGSATTKTLTQGESAIITADGTGWLMFKFTSGGGGSFATITGSPSDNVALQAALDLKLAISAAAAAYQPLDGDLTYLAGFTPTANVKSVLNAADYAAIRTLLGLVIGTNVQAYDADLLTYAGITPAANVQSILSAADYSAIRTLLGLVISTNVQAYDADLLTYAGITPSANVQSVLSAADYSAIRTLLGLVIGTHVQAYDTDLAYLAGFTPTANVKSILTAADYAAINTLLGTVSLSADNAFTGINRWAGAEVTTPNAMAALAIDVTKSLNTKTVSADSTFTFSGTPATGNTWFTFRVTNSDSSDHVMTIPSSFNANTQALSTTFGVIAGGTETITFCYDGSRYVAYGIPSADYAADAGANDTYAITLNPVLTAYGTGARFWFRANTANTGAATLNISALGAKTIKKVAGGITTDLADNDIRANQLVGVIYDGTNFQMFSQLGNAPAGSGDALVANPLSQFAATTSAQLRGVLSDEDGTGVFVTQGGNMGAGTATTPSAGDNDTSIATTAFVEAANNKSYTVSITADGLSDDTYTGATLITGKNAGATVAQWDLVYLNSSGNWVLCDADAGTPLGITGMVGLAITSGTNGNPLTVLQKGFIRNDGWAWTAGSRLYASGTAGGMTHTAPSTATNAIMVVGAAVTDDEVWFDGTLIWAIKG